EVDNPYFNVNKNLNNSKQNRLTTNFGMSLTPWAWGELKTNIGVDGYTTQYTTLRSPESALGFSNNGIIDFADDITRNINVQTLLNFAPRVVTHDLTVSGFLGHAVQDAKSVVDALKGSDFLDPNFISINNTNSRTNRSTTTQRRLVSAFGQVTFDWRRYLYLNVTGRNDWTSTIPVP